MADEPTSKGEETTVYVIRDTWAPWNAGRQIDLTAHRVLRRPKGVRFLGDTWQERQPAAFDAKQYVPIEDVSFSVEGARSRFIAAKLREVERLRKLISRELACIDAAKALTLEDPSLLVKED